MSKDIQEGKKAERSLNFIENIVEEDLRKGLNDGRIQTRFPPEPNGYLHIGHAKAICIDFGIAERYGGICKLRLDDTNPTKEDTEYVDAIMEDIRWLGFKWDEVCYASDYFGQLYAFAMDLIVRGHAYVEEQDAATIAQQRGTPNAPGIESPFRNRPPQESLKLFQEMNAGIHPEGSLTLRAKIDMASPNMHMRDPIIYRITKHPHHRTGNEWNVYPMYDFAHGQCDYFEGVTHSICTLEFVVHRPLYDHFVELLKTDNYRPYQYEFNRLNLTYTLMSKRKLHQLVKEGIVKGWDDPRMPTLCGLRRRGYTPEAIKNFVKLIGYTKYEGTIDVDLLEHAVREDLNKRATRVSVVQDPIELIISNYPEGKTEQMLCTNNPEDPHSQKHEICFQRELFIEREDFMEDAPKGYFRLSPGKEVRLVNAYIVCCTHCEKDEAGQVKKVYATYDPNSRSGQDTSGKKVKGTIHWVSQSDALDVELRLYDRLFTEEQPIDPETGDFHHSLNPDSLKIVRHAKAEAYLRGAQAYDLYQFRRRAYFNVDPDSQPDALVFNLTVSLKDKNKKKAVQ